MYYFGIVEDINDPLKLGRVKVRVHDIHTLSSGGSKYNIDTVDLGWSNVVLPTTTPGINGKGHSVNLNARVLWKEGDVLPDGKAIGDERVTGSLVCGIFLDRTLQEFMVIGSLPTKSHGQEDNNLRVRGEANPHVGEPIGVYQPKNVYNPIFPNNNVYETESGHVKEYDDTEGYERITERHRSGTQYCIDPNGSKNETIVRDNYRLVVGQDTLEVTGNVKIIVSGNVDLAVAKDLNAHVGGNMNTTVDGNADLLVKGDIDGEVRGNIDIDVGSSDPEHVIYNDEGIAVHHVKLGGYTRNKAIEQWFPKVKTDTFTLTHKNMRKVKEMSATAQAPYAAALATFADYDPSKVKLVNGSWTYPNKTSYPASFGNIELHTEGGLNAIIGGEADMTIFQNAKLDIRKNADIDIGGNVDMDVVGNIVIDATGDESIIDINTTGDTSQIDVNSAGLLKVFSTGTTDVESTADMTLKSADIKLDGNVEVTGNLKVVGTTHTSTSQLIDGHNHVISGGSSAGNTGNLS
jgi:hypothetical protein